MGLVVKPQRRDWPGKSKAEAAASAGLGEG
jgi:hypothetical protein